MELKLNRCIWFGSLRMEPNSYARVCFRTPTRSGTLLPVPSTSASSLLYILQVISSPFFFSYYLFVCPTFCIAAIWSALNLMLMHCHIVNDLLVMHEAGSCFVVLWSIKSELGIWLLHNLVFVPVRISLSIA